MTTRYVALIILAVPAFAVSYYFGFALPRIERERLEFERTKYQQAQIDKYSDEALKHTDDSLRAADRATCLDEADTAYWEYIKVNGKRDSNKPDVWIAPQSVWDEAAKRKKSDRDECYRKYPP